MTSLTVMMSNFGPDTTTRTVTCMDCGREIIADNRTRVKRCPECRDEYYRTRDRAAYKSTVDLDDPALNLCRAMILQARIDKRAGDRDAAQWLATDAPLWLRACGIGVTRSMRDELTRGRG